MGYVRNNFACVECTQLTGIWDPLHEISRKNIKVRLKHFYHLSFQSYENRQGVRYSFWYLLLESYATLLFSDT